MNNLKVGLQYFEPYCINFHYCIPLLRILIKLIEFKYHNFFYNKENTMQYNIKRNQVNLNINGLLKLDCSDHRALKLLLYLNIKESTG